MQQDVKLNNNFSCNHTCTFLKANYLMTHGIKKFILVFIILNQLIISPLFNLRFKGC